MGGNHGVVFVHRHQLFGIALLLCLKQNLEPFDLLLLFEPVPFDLGDLLVRLPQRVEGLLPRGADLHGLAHEISPLRPLVRNHLLQHRHALGVGLLLHLLLQSHLLHGRLSVTEDALQPHLVVGDVCELPLCGVNCQAGGVQLHHQILHLRHQSLLLLLQALPEPRLLRQLVVQAQHILTEIVQLDAHGAMDILQLLVRDLQSFQRRLRPVDLINLAVQLDLHSAVHKVQVVQLLLEVAPFLNQRELVLLQAPKLLA
mmetsp:Transcript_40230/g.94224  ORF Transcript_40230/g.94224 Transcript_40230/m.94224 type:complete len:257 (-) Transcript_40230:1476-2246(-)